MKRYELKKDLPTFKAGEIFYLSDMGNLMRESDNVPAYSWSTIDKFPNILAEWFEEIKPTRWKPEMDQTYYGISIGSSVFSEYWNDLTVDHDRFNIGNCFQTKEEAEKAVEYLKALAVVRGDATTKFIKGKSNYYVVYNASYNCLDVSDNVHLVKNGIFGLPYFATEDDARKSIELHKNEWLTIFGVKEEDEAQK